jgi:hypothetical protein
MIADLHSKATTISRNQRGANPRSRAFEVAKSVPHPHLPADDIIMVIKRIMLQMLGSIPHRAKVVMYCQVTCNLPNTFFKRIIPSVTLEEERRERYSQTARIFHIFSCNGADTDMGKTRGADIVEGERRYIERGIVRRSQDQRCRTFHLI